MAYLRSLTVCASRAATSCALAVVLGAVGCGSRTLSTDDSGAGAGDGSGAGQCEHPQGTCDFDADCAPDERCVGARRTVGTPHLFVCKGICERKEETPAIPPCDHAGDPQLAVSLSSEGGRVTARISNVGCTPAYRMHGCCNEGAALVEVQDALNGWQPAKCAPGPGVCCDAEPQCTPLAPGDSLQLDVPELSAALCCGTTFRVAVGYSRNPSCIDDTRGIALVAHSNALTLRDEDTCDLPPGGSTPCGTSECKTDTEVCVRLDAWQSTWECRPVPVQCAGNRSCACLGKQVCTGAFDYCADVGSASNTISCQCAAC